MSLHQPSDLSSPPSAGYYRWVQLTAGIVGMVAVANFQYSWTLFVLPLHGAARLEPRWRSANALSIFFISAQTWLVPVEGYLADRFGPRRLLVLGGVLAGLAWVIIADTTSLAVLYAAQVLCGCGSGIVYGISMGSALKWFPDRRGLAAGLTAAAFGAGSAATVLPDQLDHRASRLRDGLPLVRPGTGAGDHAGRPGDALSQAGRGAGPDSAEGPAVGPRLHAAGDAALAGVLAALRHDDDGGDPGPADAGQIEPMAKDFGVAEMPVTLLRRHARPPCPSP